MQERLGAWLRAERRRIRRESDTPAEAQHLAAVCELGVGTAIRGWDGTHAARRMSLEVHQHAASWRWRRASAVRDQAVASQLRMLCRTAARAACRDTDDGDMRMVLALGGSHGQLMARMAAAWPRRRCGAAGFLWAQVVAARSAAMRAAGTRASTTGRLADRVRAAAGGV